MPSMDQWEKECRRNDRSSVKGALREHGWVRKTAPPSQGPVRRQMNLCWAKVMETKADQVAMVLPSFGVLPVRPYGEEFGKQLGKLFTALEKDCFSYTKTKPQLIWAQLAPVLPHLSLEQARKLAKAGDQEGLSTLLASGAWKPSSVEFFEVAGTLEKGFGHKGDYLLEEGHRALPNLVDEQPEAFARSVGRLVKNYAQRFAGETYRNANDARAKEAAAKEADLVELCRALEPHGGLKGVVLNAVVAKSGNLAMLSVLGRVGCGLSVGAMERGKFFREVLAVPFEGNSDPRLEEVPWRAWVCKAPSAAVEHDSNPAVVAHWKQWVLDQRLDASPDTLSRRSKSRM